MILNYLVIALLILLAMKAQATNPATPVYTVTNSQGTFRRIRPAGAKREDGSFEVELWAKDGVSTSDTVYMPSLNSTPENPFFVPLAGLTGNEGGIDVTGWQNDLIS